MTDEIDDGGPAFSSSGLVTPNGDVIYGWNGMSLRDYFAAAALQGMLASEVYMREIDETAEKFIGDDGWRPTDAQKKQAQVNVVSRTAYDLADALIARRKP
jgi:hypothetical protein